MGPNFKEKIIEWKYLWAFVQYSGPTKKKHFYYETRTKRFSQTEAKTIQWLKTNSRTLPVVQKRLLYICLLVQCP